MAGDLFRRMRGGLGGIAVLSLLQGPLMAADPVTDYVALLAQSVKEDGVDYVEIAAGRAALDAYVRWLATADPGPTDADRTAFWINAHNAIVLRQAIDAGAAGRAWRVAGRDVTLDGIEAIARGSGGPLVHFALHRAARSSPPLSAALYRAGDLREALEQQARAYLSDGEQNRFAYAQLEAELSMIFFWHREDFEAGQQGEMPPLQLFLAAHLPKGREEIARSLSTTRWRISFRPYDGSLDASGPRRAPVPAIWIVLYAAVATALLFLGFRVFRTLLRAPPAPAPPVPPRAE